jgi:alpha-tubulin suppressor-like RCC1 family protein
MFQSLSLERVIDLYTHGPTFQPTVQPSLAQISPSKLFSAGIGHVVSIQPDGTAFSWGKNKQGHLGRGFLSNYEASAGLMVNITAASDVSAGGFHTMLVQDGAVWSVGSNAFGGLGDNTTLTKSSAEPLTMLSSGVARVDCGMYHSCAVLETGWFCYLSNCMPDVHSHYCLKGALYCWGRDLSGELGINGSTFSLMLGPSIWYLSLTPVPVTGYEISGVSSVSAGADFTCLLTTSGVAKCVGSNSLGQLGDGTLTSQKTYATEVQGVVLPVGVFSFGFTINTDVIQVLAIESSLDAHSCVLDSSPAVRCFGSDSNGQIGNGR